jgi:hypothetical protein
LRRSLEKPCGQSFLGVQRSQNLFRSQRSQIDSRSLGKRKYFIFGGAVYNFRVPASFSINLRLAFHFPK